MRVRADRARFLVPAVLQVEYTETGAMMRRCNIDGRGLDGIQGTTRRERNNVKNASDILNAGLRAPG